MGMIIRGIIASCASVPLVICDAISFPMAISFSWEMMLRWATRRLPISFTSLFLSAAQTERAGSNKIAERTLTLDARFLMPILPRALMDRLYTLRPQKSPACGAFGSSRLDRSRAYLGQFAPNVPGSAGRLRLH